MKNPTVRRIGLIAAIVLSAMVLLLAVASIVGVWFGNWVAQNVVIDLSVGVEQTAQALERGVVRLNDGIGNLRADVQQVDQAGQRLSENVADEGLVRTLLPEAQEQRLQDTAARINETFDALRDSYTSARSLYRSLNRIPGVNLPELGEGPLQTVADDMNQARAEVRALRERIQQVRQRQANAIARVREVTTRVDTRLATTQERLQQVQTGLVNAQTVAQQLRRVLPPILTVLSILWTLILVWVIVTQVLVIRMAWRIWKSKSAQAQAA